MPFSNKNLGNTWLLEILQAVNAHVSPDTLFRKFAQDVSDSLGIKTIQIYGFQPSGDLRVRHYYGLKDHEVASFIDISPSASLPVVDCIKSKQTLILASKAEIEELYPVAKDWVYVPESILCFPLMTGNVIEGSMVYTFDNPLTEAPFDISEHYPALRVIGELCQLLVSRLNPSPVAINKAVTSNHSGETAFSRSATLPSDEFELTPRHKEMLTLLAKGLTNREIAQSMNYSEATTRIELGKLFARIGVNNRQEAAAVAHKYGC